MDRVTSNFFGCPGVPGGNKGPQISKTSSPVFDLCERELLMRALLLAIARYHYHTSGSQCFVPRGGPTQASSASVEIWPEVHTALALICLDESFCVLRMPVLSGI